MMKVYIDTVEQEMQMLRQGLEAQGVQFDSSGMPVDDVSAGAGAGAGAGAAPDQPTAAAAAPPPAARAAPMVSLPE